MSAPAVLQAPCSPLDRQQISDRLRDCGNLPSLGAIDSALKDLLRSDERYTSQIAEIIERDPGLTSRLLRLVNSVFYGFPKPVRRVEDAVFYVGVRQIRQLAMMTTIIEDLQKLAGNNLFPWREFWRHCVGTALVTREVSELVEPGIEDFHYVGGLIHDIGKIVMASTFPAHFKRIHSAENKDDLLRLEVEILGVDHAELGALYLKKQILPEYFVEVVQFHHRPDLATQHPKSAAAINVADLMVRQANIGRSGSVAPVTEEVLVASTGWRILFANRTPQEVAKMREQLKVAVDRLPAMLAGLL